MAAAFGPSAWWAPWRLVWRVLPALDAVFPDLNGTWTGTTKSNWPVHHLMLQAAEGAVVLDRASLAAVPLEEGSIKLTIKASLFALRIAGELGRTGGSSHSTTVRVSRDENRDAWRLDYVYRQDTPQPVDTDEGSHVGAATVRLDGSSKPPTLIGEYWTRRRWRSGLNTAGLIEVTRSSR
nr:MULTISPECIES: hypothetical protein [unclassified Sphingomonas]